MNESKRIIIRNTSNGYVVYSGEGCADETHVFTDFDALVAHLRTALPVFGPTLIPTSFTASMSDFALGNTVSLETALSQIPTPASDPNYCELCETRDCDNPVDISGAPKTTKLFGDAL